MTKYVFCVDSDGCSMDTMTYKHELYFGPLIQKYFLIADPETFQKNWEDFNLYTRTRGVNRFLGLVHALQEAGVTGIDKLVEWSETTTSLSNASLEATLKEHPSADLQAALDWSNDVNRSIKAHQEPALAFPGAKEGLAALSQIGKVYVVSSANKEAVLEEWEQQGLAPYITDFYCQDRGKKEDVIASLVDEVDSPSNLLMIGDSPGDLVAAEQNKVAFYPILVGKEVTSWAQLKDVELARFVAGQYDENYYRQIFWENLK
ncbi:HAD hydrolase-like protein [Streptococcus gallolyticus]|nr:HAD hydrolase-like protein [Streptococcus gallolyticus]MBY5041233.1 HAD hydrolase-like protein [Streptococcus gallolyticus]